MSKSPGNAERKALASMLNHCDTLPSVAAKKTLIRAGFLVTNGAHRPYHKFGLNLSGMVLLIGLLIAVVRGISTGRTDEAKFNDRPGTVFLLLVVVTGFVAQAMHFANLPPDPSRGWALLGHWLGEAIRPGAPYIGSYSFFWMAHALTASAFLAYLGWSRMIHIFAAPLGRIFYSQEALREAKVRTVMEGLLKPRTGRS